jgi:ABC-2 type transport system ATP-binding protein
MIVINNITKIYNKRTVVHIPYLEVREKEIIGLVGNNGAGKTTLFRLMLDLVPAEKGFITFYNKNVAITEQWKGYTAAYLDEGFLIGHLTPEEFFYFCGKLHNLSPADVDEFLKSLKGFFESGIIKSGKYIRELSKGNQFKIGIAASLLQQPKILILDEPFANLDPSSQLMLINIIKNLYQQRDITIFISSHDINHITTLCTRILLMESGEIIKDIITEHNTLTTLKKYFKV